MVDGMQINWDVFKAYNQDSRGVRFKFEDLCRQLFIRENLSGNKQFRYLHANPNNYGLETEPVFDEINSRWIGFQAKFFDGDVGYNQIKQSAEKIVEYYTGKEGTVDLVYLFCNKPISVTAQGYVDAVNLLKSSNIDIQLITNETILDLVRNKYPYLALYYFGNHMIQPDWFITQANHMFDELGERFNRNFNVETESMKELSLFVHDQRAVELLNSKKQIILKKIKELNCNNQYRGYLLKIENAVEDLPDVKIESIDSSLKWIETVKHNIQSELGEISKEVEQLNNQLDDIYQSAVANDQDKDEYRKLINNAHVIERHIDELTEFIKLPELIALTEKETSLLNGQIMLLYGKSGMGKSHLLASKTKELLDAGRIALLLIAGIYFTSDPIQEQITRNLGLDFSFDELINILETIGENKNCVIPIFIDAINETWNNRLWKNGLPKIINKLKDSPMVKLVVSYRPEYGKIVLTDNIRNDSNIVRIHQRGFEDNSLEAIKEFLNYYKIPFSPLDYFGYELSNPLFLTLYCKTYNGNELSLPALYERLIEVASIKIFETHEDALRKQGYDEGSDLLRPLISQIASYLVKHEERSISKSELMGFRYWAEYGLTPAPYIWSIVKENILYTNVFNDDEKIYFSYDQMNDYYCAKAILDLCGTKEEIRLHLSEKVLGIHEREVEKPWNIDLFVNVCALYSEKYSEECIDIIDEISDDIDREEIFSRYVSSFQWRNSTSVSKEQIIDFLSKYHCQPGSLLKMLIGNSVKVDHPFNAVFLHEFLTSYKLNQRDSFWTIYINNLSLDDSDRLVQLIQMYNCGEKLKIINEKQIDLLLILFGWLLTSSNRMLRDYTSKAMIEILKENFDSCITLIERFQDVNDPYVIQRLYGVVFGACCKRNKCDLKTLAEYIYESVFNKDKVYPDILLRDYARLIIERFLYETPDYEGVISRKKITPPYKSEPIPEIDYQNYDEYDNYTSAVSQIIMSMRIENMGGYGDFGRYVFQRALSNFDVDMKKMFNYAVYHIINDLGFKDEYFENYDRSIRMYDRHFTAKVERIGKKYQWITMYEMLARITDNCKMIDRWGYPEKDEIEFEGAWEPYVRDFDPTLNDKFLVCKEAPFFEALEAHKKKGIIENTETDISTRNLQDSWLEQSGVFCKDLKDTLILSDENGQQWVSLTKYCDTGRKNLNNRRLLVWSWIYAYFMTSEQALEFKKCSRKGLSVINSDIASHHETYTVFNREYPWSPSCKEFEEAAWVDSQILTGEVETVTESSQVPEQIYDLLREYGLDSICSDPSENSLHIRNTRTFQRDVVKGNGKILHATTNLLWEEEYDASKDDTISISVPCGMLIEKMGLKQYCENGFYFDSKGRLAAFDTNLTQGVKSVVVRKEVLDEFLELTNMKLVWFVDANKEIHSKDLFIESRSEWEAVYMYDKNQVCGEINRITIERPEQ